MWKPVCWQNGPNVIIAHLAACSITSAVRRRTCRETNSQEAGFQREELNDSSNVQYNRLRSGWNGSGSAILNSNGSSHNNSSSRTTTIGKHSRSGSSSWGVGSNTSGWSMSNTLDISDQTIPAALQEKNEIVQSRRVSLPRASEKTSSSQPQLRR